MAKKKKKVAGKKHTAPQERPYKMDYPSRHIPLFSAFQGIKNTPGKRYQPASQTRTWKFWG